MPILNELIPGSDVVQGVGVDVDLARRTVTVHNATYGPRDIRIIRAHAAALDEAADVLEAMKEGDR